VVALSAVYVAKNLIVSQDLVAFVSDGADAEKARTIRALAQSPASRILTVMLAVKDGESIDAVATRQWADELASRLAARAEVEWVRDGATDGEGEELFALYQEHALAMSFSQPEREIAALASDEQLKPIFARLRDELAKPMGMLVKQIAPADPLLTTFDRMQKMADRHQGKLAVAEGRLRAESGEAVLFISTRASAFESEAQNAIAAVIEDSRVQRALAWHGTNRLPTVLQSGIAPHARASEKAIRADVTRISTVSTLALLALVFYCFRTVRAIVALALPIVGAMVVALAASLLLWGEIAGLTLAFGATLIGISIDYPLHLYCHGICGGLSDARERRSVGLALVLGAATTIVGFGGLAATSFPGMHQIALFTATGLVSALVGSWFLVPLCLPASSAPTPVVQRFSRRSQSFFLHLQTRPARFAAIGLAIALPGLVGLSGLRFEDHPEAWILRDPEVVAQDHLVRQKLGQGEDAGLIVARGPSFAEALAVNDQLHDELAQACDRQGVERPRSLHDFLWSPDLQRRNLSAWRNLTASPDFFATWNRALEDAGFRRQAFAPFEAKLSELAKAQDDGEILTIEQIEATALGRLVQPFVLPLAPSNGAALVTQVPAGLAPAALERVLAKVQGASFIDQKEILRAIYAENRVSTIYVCGLGVFAIAAILWARYRAFWVMVGALLPALLAGASGLGMASLLGFQLNLFHVVCLVLVLSMGVDYSIFLAEAGRTIRVADGAKLGPTFLSIALSCVSTVLSLGLLAWSSQPLLRSMGVVVGFGVWMAWLLSPLVLFVQRRANGRHSFDGAAAR
jgi:predicted exporter